MSDKEAHDFMRRKRETLEKKKEQNKRKKANKKE